MGNEVRLGRNRFNAEDDRQIHQGAAAVVDRQKATAAIEQRYDELGRSLSPLGLAAGDAVTLQPDGTTFLKDFRGGQIAFDSTTGQTQAVVKAVAEITYKGLKCFGRQGGLGTDQPYVIMSVIQTDPYVEGDQIKVATHRAPETDTYTDVDSGQTRTAGIRTFFADAPQDIIINSVVMEHDDGDPEKVKEAVKDALKKAADAGVAAVTGGAGGAPLDPSSLQGMAVDWLAEKLASLTGAGDDKLGDGSIVIPFSTWAQGTFPPRETRDGIEYNYKQYCTDGDASYDVMYDVRVTQVSREV